MKVLNNVLPELPKKLETKDFEIPLKINYENWDNETTGSNFFYDDYLVDEKIHHLDGQTIEEAEHQLATQTLSE